MAEEGAPRVPLLGGAPRVGGLGSTLSAVGRAMSTNRFWRRTSDVLSLVVCGVGFGSSAYLLSSSTSGSICRPPVPNGFEILFTILPIMVGAVALALSDGLRVATGGSPSRILSLIHHLLSALVAAWLTLCLSSAPGWVSVVVLVLLLSGAGTLWFYWTEEEEEA